MEQWESDLEALILEKGEALGVNAISDALGIPLTTMQRKLEKSKFVKNSARKWDLPEKNILDSTNTDTYAKALDVQIDAVKAFTDMLIGALDTSVNLIAIQKSLGHSVADVSAMSNNTTTKLDKRLEDVLDNLKLVPKLIKEHKSKISSDYHEVLDNCDWLDMFIQVGRVGSLPVLNNINSIILEDTDTLTNETLDRLLMHQKSK